MRGKVIQTYPTLCEKVIDLLLNHDLAVISTFLEPCVQLYLAHPGLITARPVD